MDNSWHDDGGRVSYGTAGGPDPDGDGPVMLIAVVALLAFAAGFWALWWWSWHEIGYYTLPAIGVPVLIFFVFTVATTP